MKRNLTAIILAALLLAPTLAACASDGDSPTTGTESSASLTDTTTPETEEEYLGEKNLDGFTFRVNARGASTGNGAFYVQDFYTEETTGETINDAVYERNDIMQSKYNFKIEQVYSAADQLGELRAAVSSGDAIQAAIVLNTSVAALAQEGYLMDLYSLPYVDFTASWWDQNAVEAFTILDKMFFTSGDMNLVAFDRTCVVTFNKTLLADNNLENPYDLVKAGTWTIDKMYEMAVQVNRDMDSDGKLTSDSGDVVGLFVYNMAPQYYYYGAGERISTFNDEGVPQLTVYNDRSAEVVDKLFRYLNKSNTDVITGLWAPMSKMFTENRALFANVSVSDAKNSFRENCEEDFGFLPIAKYDESQDRYYNLVGMHDWTHFWCVPTSCSDADSVGFLLEAFAYYSTDTVRAAYYDITLSGKVVRDRESNDMLDLIFANRVYDIATIYDWGGWSTYLGSTLVSAGSNSFAAMYRKLQTKTETAINETVQAYSTSLN